MLALFLYPQYARKEVNAMPYIPKDQIAAAREMDLLTYLRRFDLKLSFPETKPSVLAALLRLFPQLFHQW